MDFINHPYSNNERKDPVYCSALSSQPPEMRPSLFCSSARCEVVCKTILVFGAGLQAYLVILLLMFTSSVSFAGSKGRHRLVNRQKIDLKKALKDLGFGVPSCAKELRTFSEEKVDEDMRAALDPILANDLPRMLSRESGDSELLLLEPIRHDLVEAHELRTARDYAKFVRQRNEHFLFLSYIGDQSLPTFDGIQLNGAGKPIANISLKYASLKNEQGDLAALSQHILMRLNRAEARGSLASPSNWFRRSNSLPHPENGFYHSKDYLKQIERAAFSASLLNLFNSEGEPYGRRFLTVVDMRDSGYAFELFSDEQAANEILKIVDSEKYGNHSLILLWDDHRVIEFGQHRALVFGQTRTTP